MVGRGLVRGVVAGAMSSQRCDTPWYLMRGSASHSDG